MSLKDYIIKKKKATEEYFKRQREQREVREQRNFETLKARSKIAEHDLSKMKATDRYKQTIKKAQDARFRGSALGGFLGGGSLPVSKSPKKVVHDMGLGEGSRSNFDMLGAAGGLFDQAQPKPKKRKKSRSKKKKGGKSITIRLN